MTVEKYITTEGVVSAALVILALAWAFNIICSAVANIRKAKERTGEPVRELQTKVETVEDSVRNIENHFNEMCRNVNLRIDELERGVIAHTSELKDLHTGQTELCRGVQALLEHALHNGNEAEMSAASQSIGKWLRTR